MQTKEKIEELRLKSHQRPSVADKKKNQKEISAENSNFAVDPRSGARPSDLRQGATEYKRGADENVHPMSGADDKRLLKHYAKQISGENVASELVMEKAQLAKDLYTFVNGKEPTTEQMAKMVSNSIAFDKLHPTSKIPHIMAKREAILAQHSSNTSKRSVIRE